MYGVLRAIKQRCQTHGPVGTGRKPWGIGAGIAIFDGTAAATLLPVLCSGSTP